MTTYERHYVIPYDPRPRAARKSYVLNMDYVDEEEPDRAAAMTRRYRDPQNRYYDDPRDRYYDRRDGYYDDPGSASYGRTCAQPYSWNPLACLPPPPPMCCPPQPRCCPPPPPCPKPEPCPEYRPVYQPVVQRVYRPVKQTFYQPVERTIYQPEDQTVYRQVGTRAVPAGTTAVPGLVGDPSQPPIYRTVGSVGAVGTTMVAPISDGTTISNNYNLTTGPVARTTRYVRRS